MPARKADLEMIPHAVAVAMAPDSPLKQEVTEHAQRIIAPRMHWLNHLHEAAQAGVARASRYIRGLNDAVAPAPDAPPRRDPGAVTLAQSNRSISLSLQLLRDMDRLTESAYRQAREAAYRRTGERVGPLFWSDTELPQAPQPAAPVPQQAAPTGPSADEVAQALAAVPGYKQLMQQTVSKRTLLSGQEEMARAGLPRRAQVDLARRARQQRWTVDRFTTEVAAAIATSGKYAA